ncbi:MAG: hypothetical protein QOI53_3165 [Verrucomicrobiota bacterium]|jgi:hypothetical protein|nr:hypothetical protein [Verrucomicrobiota bacterium]
MASTRKSENDCQCQLQATAGCPGLQYRGYPHGGFCLQRPWLKLGLTRCWSLPCRCDVTGRKEPELRNSWCNVWTRNTCSAIKLSRQESLVESRFAERRDKLMIVDTPASFAACAKFYGRMDQARLDGPTKISSIETFHCRTDCVDFEEVA